MPSIKDLKKRIGSVKNTQQTTKAMKMVSAAKFRRAQEAVLQGRSYSIMLRNLAVEASVALPENYASALLEAGAGNAQAKKKLLLVVTSDRGLCGGFNSNVIRVVSRLLSSEGGEHYELSFVGKRGYDFFRSKNVKVGKYYQELSGKFDIRKIRAVSKDIQNKFLSGEYSSIDVVYNEFKNAALQIVSTKTVLPISAKDILTSDKSEKKKSGVLKFYPNAKEFMDGVLEKILPSQISNIVLESTAGEHGARMSAMENATKNAGEMIRKLTLQYNKQRQAGITKELLEIIAGSESAKA